MEWRGATYVAVEYHYIAILPLYIPGWHVERDDDDASLDLFLRVEQH
jgi:hypothetical protein